MEDSDSWWIVLGWTILLLFLNSLFTASEMAVRYSCARKPKPEMPGSANDFLIVIQTGRALASLGLGWIGGSLLVQVLESWFGELGLFAGTLPFILFVAVFVVLVYLHAVFGGIIPKFLAIRKAGRAARCLRPWLMRIYRLFKPIVQVLQRPVFLRLRELEQNAWKKNILLEDEIYQSLLQSYRNGIVDEKAYNLFDNVFAFVDRPVREVMVPRVEMVCLYVGQSICDISRVIRQTGYTRYPLCGRDKDEILGIIHIRDVLEKMQQGGNREIKELMRPVIFVPETMRLKEMLRHLQKERSGLAVVVDEFGGTSGLATIEDLIAVILKEIPCPVYKNKPMIHLSEDGAEIDSGCLIADVNQCLHCQIQDTHNDTIGGWVFSQLAKAPEIGDWVIFDRWVFTVKKTDQLRISRIEVSLLDQYQHFFVTSEESAGSQPIHPEWKRALLHLTK